MYWSFLEDLLPNETDILCWKYTFYFGYKHKIHELVIFNQTTKIDAHEEKYFHSIVSYLRRPLNGINASSILISLCGVYSLWHLSLQLSRMNLILCSVSPWLSPASSLKRRERLIWTNLSWGIISPNFYLTKRNSVLSGQWSSSLSNFITSN